MTAWTPGPGPKAPFVVKAGAVPGSVRVAVRAAAKEAAYEWQWSDDGGKTWMSAPATTQATTVVSGLLSDAVCLFRWGAMTRRSRRDWSEPLAFPVPKGASRTSRRDAPARWRVSASRRTGTLGR